ncbi:hypothetical protein QBC34DRAFT_117375 [Podospora aff. communis PSN243]|uniref:Uncharacterized protein n=1 Tax=Podospora aff. communis PSN243 TaxID=3040156 RepID=A0AAV9GNQ3_9PEZI|nr:hypothetical protein QBC34DRAFT_117375 [Podospora aff. communis PSN243]
MISPPPGRPASATAGWPSRFRVAGATHLCVWCNFARLVSYLAPRAADLSAGLSGRSGESAATGVCLAWRLAVCEAIGGCWTCLSFVCWRLWYPFSTYLRAHGPEGMVRVWMGAVCLCLVAFYFMMESKHDVSVLKGAFWGVWGLGGCVEMMLSR